MRILDVYQIFPITIERAEGCWLYAADKQRYLDLYGGHAVISVGHNHPHYNEKIKQQLEKIGFYSNSVIIDLQHKLASSLGRLSGYQDYNLFLSNSGAEANENAFKVASFNTGRKKILALNRSFHGRTSAAVEATDDSNLSAPVNQNGNTVFVPINDSETLARELEKKEYAALIIEGIQGVGGVNVPETAFLKTARRICTETGTFLILDEIQSGYGRSGKFFAHQHAEIRPDIITIAKGMGNGFPVAGTILRPSVNITKGQLGTTFGGNHLACAAALAVLEIMESEDLIRKAERTGSELISRLEKVSGVKRVKGKGLMIGIELYDNGPEVRRLLLEEHKIFIGTSSDKNVLRLLPSLNIEMKQLEHFIQSLTHAIESTLVRS